MTKNLNRIGSAVSVSILTMALASGAAFAKSPQDVVLSFSTVGDSREDPTTTTLNAQNKIWLQNTAAWSRIMETISAQKSKLLFFNGDMIMGYGTADYSKINTTSLAAAAGSDFVKYYQQYAFWRGMVAHLMEDGTYVVPVPGNHEVQRKSPTKQALEVNENVWRENMGDLILDKTRFSSVVGLDATNFSGDLDAANPAIFPGKADGDLTSQKQLSYSFDVADSHFAIVNTDPVGQDGNPPTNWLQNDLLAAQGRGQKHIYVFGHKPVYPYIYKAGVAPSGINPNAADAFWNVIETYHATYFCGHEHIYNVSQPTASKGGKSWQVIVGSGGSPFEAAPADVQANATLNPKTDRDYAWATVKIRRNGKVDMTTYGFSDSYGPTKVLERVSLD